MFVYTFCVAVIVMRSILTLETGNVEAHRCLSGRGCGATFSPPGEDSRGGTEECDVRVVINRH